MVNFREYSIDTLARWSCTLNSFKYPEDMPEKPEDFDSLPDYSRDTAVKTKYIVIGPIKSKIDSLIGKKEVLRWHHINNLHRTNEQFENWWKSACNIYKSI